MSQSYWDDALSHVVKGINAIPHSSTGRSPYQNFLDKSPAYVKHMRAFGCCVLVTTTKRGQKKFDESDIEGLNLGPVGGGMYKVLSNEGTVVSKHVKFFEDQFPERRTKEPGDTAEETE